MVGVGGGVTIGGGTVAGCPGAGSGVGAGVGAGDCGPPVGPGPGVGVGTGVGVGAGVGVGVGFGVGFGTGFGFAAGFGAGFGAAVAVEGVATGEAGVAGATEAGRSRTATTSDPGRRATAGGRRSATFAAGGFCGRSRCRDLGHVDHRRPARVRECLRRQDATDPGRVVERSAPEVAGGHGDGHQARHAKDCPGGSHYGPEYSLFGGCPTAEPIEGWRTGLEPATTGTTTRGSTN